MTALVTQWPARRAELAIRPFGDGGQHVVKDPRSGEFFHLGEQKSFLLTHLDGQNDASTLCRTFAERFGEPLSEQGLDGFVAIARKKGLLGEKRARVREWSADARCSLHRTSCPAPHSQQSIFYWRKHLFNPDQLFNVLEPHVRFFWTKVFL